MLVYQRVLPSFMRIVTNPFFAAPDEAVDFGVTEAELGTCNIMELFFLWILYVRSTTLNQLLTFLKPLSSQQCG